MHSRHCSHCSMSWKSIKHIRKYVFLIFCKSSISPYKKRLHTKLIHSFNSSVGIAPHKISRFVGLISNYAENNYFKENY